LGWGEGYKKNGWGKNAKLRRERGGQHLGWGGFFVGQGGWGGNGKNRPKKVATGNGGGGWEGTRLEKKLRQESKEGLWIATPGKGFGC